MEIDVQPGRYVAAVSGGVDSMTLLDLLRRRPGLEVIVAHFDHGIRSDAGEDRKLVHAVAGRYGMLFVYDEGKLGAGASEEKARVARYAFLEKVRQEQDAQAIITAHHQDDMLETAILNLLRGTGRKGLTSLASRPGIIRPLLHVPKQDIIAYAVRQELAWREDTTNTDDAYLRNYIRHHILPRFDVAARETLIAIIERTRRVNESIDEQLLDMFLMPSEADGLDRLRFSQLPHTVAKEFLAGWLRSNGIRTFDTGTLERVTVSAKTQRPGAIIHIVGGWAFSVTVKNLALTRIER